MQGRSHAALSIKSCTIMLPENGLRLFYLIQQIYIPIQNTLKPLRQTTDAIGIRSLPAYFAVGRISSRQKQVYCFFITLLLSMPNFNAESLFNAKSKFEYCF